MVEPIKGRRFELIYRQRLGGVGGSAKIIVDMDTGVQYLALRDGTGAGMAPLLGADGKPLLAPFARGEDAGK